MNTNLTDIRDRAQRFRYKSIGDAIADLRVVLNEVDKLEAECARLKTQVPGANYQVGDAYK